MRRTPVDERRAALVDAALRVIAREGITRATIRAIVTEAGMSLASFHYAFSSRDELIDVLVATVVANERAAILPTDPGRLRGSTLTEVIQSGLLGYLEHLARHPAHEQAMLELTQFALRTPHRRELAHRQYEQYLQLAESALELAASSTGRRWRAPVRTVARMLLSLTDGLTLGWLVDRDDEAAREAALAAGLAVAQLAEACAERAAPMILTGK